LKNRLIVILLVLFSVVVNAQQPVGIMTCHVKDISFADFCSIVFKQTSVKVFYQEKWVNNLKVTLDSDTITALMAVSEALKGTQLEVSEWHGNLVVLPGEKLLTALPPYITNATKDILSDSVAKALTESEERYITGRKADVVEIIRVGRKGGPVSGNKAKLLGRILDEDTGEPILCATIFIAETKTGAVSDLNGFVSITLKPGNYNALFEYLGYGKKKYQLEVISDGNFTVTMKKSVIQMTEVVVYGDRQMNIRAKDPGLDKMSIKSIRELPMMLGERDILKISSTLPGIISVGEGSAGLNVRGGGSDQNAFYINKIPIYNTAHLFGFFPAFNSDIIKDFSIYKGFIPAQFGGHLSSVFNIITRQGNRKHFTARGGVSPITANLVIEGPIKKDTCSFMLSGRSSYSDWILKKLNDPDIRNSSATFNDFSGGINYDIQKTQLAVFAYHSSDKFKLSDINSYEYSSNGASASFSHNYGNALRGEFSVIGSQYEFSTIDQQEVSNAYEHSYKMEHYEARADFKHMLSDRNSLEYGIGFILYKLDRGTVQPYGINSLRKTVELGTEQGIESAAYFSDTYTILPWMTLTAGIRYAMFTPLGPKTVYTYAPGEPVDPRYIVDTLNYNDHQPICWYQEPDLRIALNIETDKAGSVKLAFNQMHQNLFMLSNTITIAPNTQWKLADYHLKPSESNQVSAGIFRTLAEYGLEASAEVFYKKTRNFSEFRDGADFINNPLVETSTLQGNQTAYGVEVFLKRSSRKLEGWISYTYSRSLIKVDGGEDWNKINGGESYPANFDIPNVLNVVLNYHITRRIIFASIFTYQTGKPVTYPVSVYYVDGLPVFDYSKRNAYRIPDYIRTDISLTIEGNLKKRKLLHSSLIFSLYNATGRDNPYSVYFKTEKGFIKSYQYSVIGVPVFTTTWLFKLGNYAAE
jgi:hypothetical protein